MEPEAETTLCPAPRQGARQLPVMAAIKKSPERRTESDVDTIMKSLEYAPVFLPLPPTVRRQLCASLKAKEVQKDAVIVQDGSELDFWYVMQGTIHERGPDVDESSEAFEPLALSAGDAFGVPLSEWSATEDRMISTATYLATTPSTLLWLERDEVLRIAHPNTESTRRVEDSSGELVAVTTYRAVGKGLYQQVVVRASASKLPEYLLTDDGGPLFVEDFLMTLPVFMKDSEDLMEFLTNCIPEHVDKVANVLALWVRGHSQDFAEKPVLRQSLEYIVSALDECPPSVSGKYLQAICKRIYGGETDSLSVYSIGKSQSVTSTCSRDSNNECGEEEALMQQANSDDHSLPVLASPGAPPASPNSLQAPTSGPASVGSQSSGSDAVPGSLLRSASVSVDRRKSHRFRRKSHTPRIFGDKIPLKIYIADGSYRIVPVLDDYTCAQVVALAVKAFNTDRAAEGFSMVNVSVSPPDIVKQRSIPGTMTKLSVYQRANSRIYLKDMTLSGHVTTEETTLEMVRNSEISLHTLDLKELVRHITMADFAVFKQITAADYISDTFELQTSLASEKRMQEASDLVNIEMMWVIHEVCGEPDLQRRAHVVRIFIELALLFQRVRNFNSMLAIVSGLSYTAVTRLKRTWEKVPRKYVTSFEEMQQLLDPSRNMANYRQLFSNESLLSPFIPFFPIVKKDLTFLHLGNKTAVDGLVNVDKLRMIANEVRKTMVSTSRAYSGNDLLPGLPLVGSHLVLESFEAAALKKSYHYLMADQNVSMYMKNFEKFDKDEKTLLEMSRNLEANDPSQNGSSGERGSSTSLFIAGKTSNTLRRGQSSLRKALHKYIGAK